MERSEFLTNFIYESELIEGLNSNKDQIRKDLENNKTTGHVGAIIYLENRAREKEEVLTEDDIKRVHKYIFNESRQWNEKLNPGKGGVYDECKDLFGSLVGAPATLIPEKMKKLLNIVNKHQLLFSKQRETIDLELISNFHYHFGIISPFATCNGLVNRALLLYLLWYFEKPPFIIPAKEKDEYLMAFRTHNPQALSEYFEKKEYESLKKPLY